MSEHFQSWWDREGKSFDPDTSDVPWEDKRKALAERAFDVAMATSQNYTANSEVDPTEVRFKNGRRVSVEDGRLAVDWGEAHSHEAPATMTFPLQAEYDYFRDHRDALVRKYAGKYLVIKDEQVIGVFDDEIGAFTETKKAHATGTFLIQLCYAGQEQVQRFHSRVAFV